jgi:4-amino-4-deoxy-L-arabinose transferase-like glycosyltransferase
VKNLLIIICIFVAFGISLFAIPQGIVAVCLTVMFSALFVFWIKRYAGIDSRDFLINLFIGALIPRLVLASVIFVFSLEGLFGPDAIGYHEEGLRLSEAIWNGTMSFSDLFSQIDFGRGDNWSMPYIVTTIYLFVGSNPLAVQAISSVVGSATAIIMYFIAQMIYSNERTAKYSAILIAFFPAMIIWSSQMLKDGFIVFLISLIIFSALRLQKKFSSLDISLLLVSLLFIFTLRFYLFPLLCAAIIGGFVINSQSNFRGVFSRIVIFASLGVVLGYFGVLERSQQDFYKMSDLTRLENIRKYGTDAADSGIYGKDDSTNISTIGGIAQALPVGITTLILAPFPWQMEKLQQQLLLPEMLLWWLMFPFLAFGLWFSLKSRLGKLISPLIFLASLTISYSLFQGNLGTMYRQRIQIQMFLLMFIAVGFVLFLERRENARSQNIKGHRSFGKI